MTAAAQAPQTADGPASASFIVLVAGARVGSETVTLKRTDNGWSISSTGRLQAPIDLTTNTFEMDYGPDWRPRQLTIDARLHGELLALKTTFTGTSAVNELTRGSTRTSSTQPVSGQSVVLPNSFFGAYEALAARLAGATAGTTLPAYIAPGQEITLTVDRVTPRRFVSPAGAVDVREFILSSSGAPSSSAPIQTPIEIWVDARGRLARLAAPAAALVVIRSDLGTVMAREERVHNPGEQDLFIAANGFSIGATITKPASTPARAPAVVFVAGAGLQDRDYATFGVPIFGQLAGALARSGYFVVRYDGRNVGQSGGRAEGAGIEDYAEDAIGVVRWLRSRPDVDQNRIAILGYDEAAAVAMVAAAREDRIKAVALVAAPGLTGREVVLEQQQHALGRLTAPAAQKAASVDLQNRIIGATLGDSAEGALPPDAITASRSAWFKSWLLFDPAKIMPEIDQPVLVLQGSLDTEMPPRYADRLDADGLARKKLPASRTRKVIVTGVNHLLITATSGEMDEYQEIETRVVAPGVGAAIVAWLGDAFGPR